MNRALLLAVPVACSIPVAAIWWGASVVWPISTAVLLPAAVMLICGLPSRVLRIAGGSAFGLIISAGNVALGASYLIQGVPFNEAFFYHLSPDLAFAGLREYGLPMAIGVMYCFGVTVLTSMAAARGRNWASAHYIALVAIALIASSAFSPFYHLTMYVLDQAYRPSSRISESELIQPIDYESANSRPNLVLIFAEGLEQRYFDSDTFPGLLPNLKRLGEESFVFTNLHQYGGNTSFTMGGIVASMCGWPFYSFADVQNINHVSVTTDFLPQLTCLGDILHKEGYFLEFIGGADLRFAGKGNFFRTHGYDRILGKRYLESNLPKKPRQSDWGIYDETLLEFARREFDNLAQKERPFALTILTLDTHHPDGLKSPSCDHYEPIENSMLDAVHCADRLLAGFIRDIRATRIGKDAIIVLLSDHLAMRNASSHLLNQSGDRRLMAMIQVPGASPQQINQPGMHYDLAPTILDLMGFQLNGPFGLGSSLLEGPGRLFSLTQGIARQRKAIERIEDSREVVDRVKSAWLRKPLNLFESNSVILHSSGWLSIADSRFDLKRKGMRDYVPTLFLFDEEGVLQKIRTFDRKTRSSSGDSLLMEAMASAQAAYQLAVAPRREFQGVPGLEGGGKRLSWAFVGPNGRLVNGQLRGFQDSLSLNRSMPDGATVFQY